MSESRHFGHAEPTHAAELEPPSEKVSGLRITYALFGGIFAWMVHLIGQSALNGYVCETGQLWPMHVITAVTLVGALHPLLVGWRISRDQRDSTNVQAARFLGWAAVVINVFNAVMIVAEWIPVLFINPCATG